MGAQVTIDTIRILENTARHITRTISSHCSRINLKDQNQGSTLANMNLKFWQYLVLFAIKVAGFVLFS